MHLEEISGISLFQGHFWWKLYFSWYEICVIKNSCFLDTRYISTESTTSVKLWFTWRDVIDVIEVYFKSGERDIDIIKIEDKIEGIKKFEIKKCATDFQFSLIDRQTLNRYQHFGKTFCENICWQRVYRKVVFWCPSFSISKAFKIAGGG